MSAVSLIERQQVKWDKLTSLLPKPTEALPRLNNLLKLCANLSYLKTGESIHAHLIVKDLLSRPEDAWQINSLINFYAKRGEAHHRARKLFDSMPERNVVSSCTLMKGYQDSGSDSEVLKLFKSIRSKLERTVDSCTDDVGQLHKSAGGDLLWEKLG